MTLNKVKIFAIALFALPIFAVAAFNTNGVRAVSTPVQEDVAATFKAKCAACHSPKAEKAFDPTKKDEELVEIVLKGKKGEKPPFMPGYEAKGMTADQAKALVSHMKSLREPAK